MPDVRLIDGTELKKHIESTICYGCEIGHMVPPCRRCYVSTVLRYIDEMPEVDAQPVKHGHWSECYRDSRCISVICSVCKNPTVIAHGCRDTDEVTMDDAIEKLPHCPKCCSDMRGDAK